MNLDYYIEFKNIIEFNNSFFNNTNSNNLIKYYNQLFGLESNITNKIIELNPKIIIRLINNNC